ncbi:MAG: hypothetical protein RDV48_29370 [Candidatus Eremiobacteraeota bacterium]|nr:hypothetical protein [Candidatus Eremiobacteraeota bacterium]
MIRAVNLEAIALRGATICGNDDFQIYICTRCGNPALYNAETLQLYLDPCNLREVKLYGEDPVTCPQCSSRESFQSAPGDREKALLDGPWSFALVP